MFILALFQLAACSGDTGCEDSCETGLVDTADTADTGDTSNTGETGDTGDTAVGTPITDTFTATYNQLDVMFIMADTDSMHNEVDAARTGLLSMINDTLHGNEFQAIDWHFGVLAAFPMIARDEVWFERGMTTEEVEAGLDGWLSLVGFEQYNQAIRTVVNKMYMEPAREVGPRFTGNHLTIIAADHDTTSTDAIEAYEFHSERWKTENEMLREASILYSDAEVQSAEGECGHGEQTAPVYAEWSKQIHSWCDTSSWSSMLDEVRDFTVENSSVFTLSQPVFDYSEIEVLVQGNLYTTWEYNHKTNKVTTENPILPGSTVTINYTW